MGQKHFSMFDIFPFSMLALEMEKNSATWGLKNA